jgi:hypothetical protein
MVLTRLTMSLTLEMGQNGYSLPHDECVIRLCVVHVAFPIVSCFNVKFHFEGCGLFSCRREEQRPTGMYHDVAKVPTWA